MALESSNYFKNKTINSKVGQLSMVDTFNRNNDDAYTFDDRSETNIGS
jgi:hypothetical protein